MTCFCITATRILTQNKDNVGVKPVSRPMQTVREPANLKGFVQT